MAKPTAAVTVRDFAVAASNSHPESDELRRLVELPDGFLVEAQRLAQLALAAYPDSAEVKHLVDRLEQELKRKEQEEQLRRGGADVY